MVSFAIEGQPGKEPRERGRPIPAGHTSPWRDLWRVSGQIAEALCHCLSRLFLTDVPSLFSLVSTTTLAGRCVYSNFAARGCCITCLKSLSSKIKIETQLWLVFKLRLISPTYNHLLGAVSGREDAGGGSLKLGTPGIPDTFHSFLSKKTTGEL